MSKAIKPYAHLCGVPREKCSGSNLLLNHGMPTNYKGHASSEAAFNCYRKHLIEQGYVQVSARDFKPPDGGPVLVTTKKSRFGAKLRIGKEGTRNMPHGHKGKGVIISL